MKEMLTFKGCQNPIRKFWNYILEFSNYILELYFGIIFWNYIKILEFLVILE